MDGAAKPLMVVRLCRKGIESYEEGPLLAGFMMNRLYFLSAGVALKPIAWLILSTSLSAPAWGQSGAVHIGFEEEQAAARAAQVRAEKLAHQEAAKEARLQVLAVELAKRQEAIVDLQSRQGIYDQSLIEAYDYVARLYNELEDYESAAGALGEALQISRINSGLYSEQQLPLVQALIDARSRIEQWQEVDDLAHLTHHISQRLYALSDRQYLSAAQDYGEWKLRVIRENLLQQNSRGLMNTTEDLSSFYEFVISGLEREADVDARGMMALLQGKSQADIVMARSIASTPYNYFQGTESQYITQSRCQNRRNAAGQVVRQCANVQVENPRYRQSQQEAKRMALYRHTSAINRSLERMRTLYRSNTRLSVSEKQELDSVVRQLQTEADTLRRVRPRGVLF